MLDTNVLVSGLLSPFGPPGEIVRMVSSGAVVLCLDARIFAEYDDVLARPRFGFDPDSVAALSTTSTSAAKWSRLSRSNSAFRIRMTSRSSRVRPPVERTVW